MNWYSVFVVSSSWLLSSITCIISLEHTVRHFSVSCYHQYANTRQSLSHSIQINDRKSSQTRCTVLKVACDERDSCILL